MVQTTDQQRASTAVASAMADRGWNPSDLAAAAEVDPGTIGDFLNGHRWPKLRTQGKIEAALGWPPGTIRKVSLGGQPPDSVEPEPEDPMITYIENNPRLSRSSKDQLLGFYRAVRERDEPRAERHPHRA